MALELDHALDVENFLVNAIFGDQQIPLTERNTMRRQLFSVHGKLPLFEGDVLEENFWAALMLGFGYVPSQQHMLISRLPPGEIDRQLLKIKGRFGNTQGVALGVLTCLGKTAILFRYCLLVSSWQCFAEVRGL